MQARYLIALILILMVLVGINISKIQKANLNEKTATGKAVVQAVNTPAENALNVEPGDLSEQPVTSIAAGLKSGELNFSDKAAFASNAAPPAQVAQPNAVKKLPAQIYSNLTISIANSGNTKIASSTPGDNQILDSAEMAAVQNMGMPLGETFKPQPVQALIQEGLESEELVLLEKKRLKRKSNFARSLERRESRKAVYKARQR